MPASQHARVSAHSRRSSLVPVDLLLCALPPALTTLHVLLAPYTKVEESFTLHALHDFILRGFGVDEHWDHVEFPGPLPRSFVPALMLSLPVKLSLAVAQLFGLEVDKFGIQILARSILGLISATSLLLVAQRLRARYGSAVFRFYILLSTTQFHTIFYASRTLPNFLALPLVNVVLALLLQTHSPASSSQRSTGVALALLSATTTLVRSELVLLLGPLTLSLLLARQISLLSAVGWSALGGLGGTLLTVLVDSYYWSHWTWPEAYGVWFNVYLNESSKWGVSPWYYYLKHLPLLLLASALLALVGLALKGARRRVEWSKIVLPSLAMVCGMSGLGHKEWRFVVYVVSWLNVPAAVTASYLWSSLPSSRMRWILKAGLIGSLLANAVASGFLTSMSVGNYPGGDVMRSLAFQSELESFRGHHLHLYSPSLPLQTGSTLFLTPTIINEDWTFNKTELPFSVELAPSFALAQDWTHVLLPLGTPEEAESWTEGGAWEEVASASGFGGLRFSRRLVLGEKRGLWVSWDWRGEGVGAGVGTRGVTIARKEGVRVVLVRRVPKVLERA